MLGTGWGADTTAARWRGDWGAPVSTTALAPQSQPFPPTKAKGWDAAGGSGKEGKGKGGRRAVTLAKLTQRHGRCPCLSRVCVVVMGLGTTEEPQKPCTH